jgi:uncharacterized protein (DUF302 family)
VSGAAGHAFLNENQTTTCSRSRAQLRLTSKGSLMPDTTQSSDGVITKPSSKSVAQTIDGLRRLIVDRGFTVFNVIDHSGVAERAGVQMPDSKLVMFGKPAVGAAVMLAAPLAALDIPLKVLVWGDHSGRCFGARKQHRTGKPVSRGRQECVPFRDGLPGGLRKRSGHHQRVATAAAGFDLPRCRRRPACAEPRRDAAFHSHTPATLESRSVHNSR